MSVKLHIFFSFTDSCDVFLGFSFKINWTQRGTQQLTDVQSYILYREKYT